MKKLLFLSTLSVGGMALSLLGGCVTSCTGDPRTDSLGCASSNLSSGRYAQDTSRLAQYAVVQEDRAVAARRQAAAIDREKSSLMAEERRLRAALSAADRAVMEAHNALVKARSESGGASAQVSQLINLLDAVQRKRGSAQRTGLDAEVIDLERDVSTLRQMVLTLASR